MAHTAEEIAGFLDGETRLIAAAWKAGLERPWFLLADGEAREHRALTKAELQCFIRDCPRSEVRVEQGLNTQRSRVPDVQITGPAGHRVAFEIQYAAITVEEFTARHADYVRAGVVDVWLFGHAGKQLRKTRRMFPEGAFKMSATHEAVRALGMPLLWFNSELAKVGTAVTTRYASRDFRVAADDGEFDLEVEALEAMEIVAAGVSSPLLTRLANGLVGWQKQTEVDLLAERSWLEKYRERQQAHMRAAAEKARARAERREELDRTNAARQPHFPPPPGRLSLREELEIRIDKRLGERSSEPAARAVKEKLDERPAPQGVQSAPQPAQEHFKCAACGGRLDPLLAGQGFHILCGPGRRR